MTDEMRVSYGFPLRVSVHTDVGRIRTNNEDSHGYAWLPDGSLFVIVADGMGGHEAGEVASGLAVQVLEEVVSRDLEADPRERLYHGLLEANEAILQEGRASGTRGMGTTAVALLCRGAEVHVGLVGDSRMYHIRRGQLVWRTLDHTRVQMLIDQGSVPEMEARSHPESGMLTRALGHSKMADGRPLVPDVLAEPVRIDRDDALVLCSDGLHDLVEDWEIGRIVAGKAPAVAAAELVRTAVERGGHDNVTVAVITAGERTSAFAEDSAPGHKPAPSGHLRAPAVSPGPPRTEFTPGAFNVTPPPVSDPEGYAAPRLPPKPPPMPPPPPAPLAQPAPTMPAATMPAATADAPPLPESHRAHEDRAHEDRAHEDRTHEEQELGAYEDGSSHGDHGAAEAHDTHEQDAHAYAGAAHEDPLQPEEYADPEPLGVLTTEETPPMSPMDAPLAPAIAALDPLPLDPHSLRPMALRPLPARAAVPEGPHDLAAQSTVVRKPVTLASAPPAPAMMPSEAGALTRKPSGGGLIFGLAAVTVVGIVAAGVVTIVLLILLVWALLSL